MKRAAALALLLLATPAVAADPAPSARYERLIAKGAELTRAGKAECLEPLVQAVFEGDKVDALYARALAAEALCHEVRTEYGEAYNTLARALEYAPPQTTAAGAAAPWTKLRADLLRIEGRVARVLVTWPAGTSLWIDGKPVIGTSGRVLAVNPGRRLFEARGTTGKAIAAAEVDARAGDVPAVHLEGAAPSPAPAATPSSNDAPAPAPSSNDRAPHPLAPALSPRGVAVSVAYAGGAVAIVAGIVAGVLEAQRGSLAAPIPLDGCSREPKAAGCDALQLAYEQSRGARTAALVAGGIGLAAAGLGVGLWLGMERGKAPASAGVSVGGSW